MKKEFSLMDFLNMLKKHLKMVVILPIIGCILALSYSFLLVTPQYTASSLILIQNYEVVNNNGDEASTDEYRVYSSDLQASATLAKNCSILFSADPDMRAVLGSSKMSVSSMDESNFLKITITSDNPQVAADTANKIADMAYDVYLEVFKAGNVTTISKAEAPTKTSSPNVVKNGLFGIVGGLVVAFVIAFLIEISDNTIKKDDDLYKIYNIPVFAEIIDFTSSEGRGNKR